MSLSHEEQRSGPPAEQQEATGPEPRLLTRPDRQPVPEDSRGSRTRQRQAPAEKGLNAWRVRPAAIGVKGTEPARPHRQRNRHARRIRLWGRIASSVLGVLLLAVLGFLVYLRHTINIALPQIDGSVQASGLRAPVTVARDAQGVPTITAANLPDLLFAQGYTTAGDRLWQMDGLRRHAAGELAEVLGPSLVEHDRRQRFLQIRAAADRAIALLPPDQLAQLEAYARGVNAYIETHSNALPVEFRLLAYRPAPWMPRDTLLVSLAMWQDLSTEFPRKLDREALSVHLPPQLLNDLYPIGSWRDQPPAAQGRDITAPHLVEQIPLDPSQSRSTPPAHLGVRPATLLTLSRELAGSQRCEGCRSGSNNWVVSGAHTASGAPLLSNDMHLNLAIPDTWYEASLHADLGAGDPAAGRVDVTGFTLPGMPFVVVGRNVHVAWGLTNLGADVQDLRIEHLRGDPGSTEYQRADGTWAPATHHVETIHVRGGLNVNLDVLTTTHPGVNGDMETPVISPLYPGEQRALSLAWTAYDPKALEVPHLALDMATDGNALVAALAHFGGPSLNLVWADSGGHIGYHALGIIPVRGPAVQHPRAVPAPIVEPGTEPPDEGTAEPAEPQALLTAQPHLILSAYVPAQRRRGAPARKPPLRTATRRPVPRGRFRKAAPAPQAPHTTAAAPSPLPAETPLPPEPVRIDYTIGSPISPVPVDALDGSQAWTAYIPYEALPSVVDPKNGLLATANARITPDDYPYAIANDWTDAFRTERIVHLLSGRRGLTPADMLHMETDVHSEVNLALAQRLAYAVDHAGKDALGADAKRLAEAANVLRSWNGDMTTNSPAAAILAVFRPALWSALLVPKIAAHDGVDAEHAAPLALLYTWGERTSALEVLVQHEPARWLPQGSANWNDFLATTLASCLRTAHAPGNLARWQYGEQHTVRLDHPIFGVHPFLSCLVGVHATTGKQPAPGDGSTIDQIGAHFGPSERFTADLSSEDAALGNITTGQSANPHSPWYLDQFRPWLAGTSFNLPSAHTEMMHTLTLRP